MPTTERNTAATALRAVEDGGYNNLVLKNLLADTTLSREQRGFVTEAVNGALRWMIYLDYCIDRFASRKTEEMDAEVRSVLRVGAYELLFMNSPAYAVINEYVECIKAGKVAYLAGFANAILRNIERNKGKIALPNPETEPTRYLSVKYAHPVWLVELWFKHYGADITEQILKADQETPRGVNICINTLKTDAVALTQELQAAGVRVEATENALTLSRASDIAGISAFRAGMFHVMDNSAMEAVRLANPQPGETVLDMCAAPGGKAFMSAIMMNNTGLIIARDIHPHKIRLIEQGAARLGLKNIKAAVHDGTIPDRELFGSMDLVILDAPCSGLGLCRKKPDIKLKKQPDNLKQLVTLQRQLLMQAAMYPNHNGRILYATCTLNKEENEQNIEWFTATNPFTKTAERTILPTGGADGFYMALLEKRN